MTERHSEIIERLQGFGPTTQLMSTDGEIPVEWLAVGDRLITRDHGAQPVLWIGRVRLGPVHRRTGAGLTIAHDAFGPGRPDYATILTEGSRVLLTGAEVELHTGTDEALASLDHLRDGAEVAPAGVSGSFFTFVLLAMPELVLANGLWVQTLEMTAAAERLLAPELPPRLVTQTLRAAHAKAPRLVLADWELRAIRGAERAVRADPDRNVA